MRKLLIAISALGIMTMGACNADFSRQTDYDYDRSVVNKAPSGGGKEDFDHPETGYIRDYDYQDNTVDRLNNGTNLRTTDVKVPVNYNQQNVNTNPPHVER